MKTQAFNPYLPSWEYIPDAEPRVFDGRVYVYGSHDRFGGALYCMNDYVCWSAPVDDLGDWRFEGTIYRKDQDPMNPDGTHCLYAPDVVRGPDGRYYLYYAFDFVGVIGVAVCDTPAGAYEFLGTVRRPDGSVLGKKTGEPFLFDPGVLVDVDGRVYLYFGFAPRRWFMRVMLGLRAFKGGHRTMGGFVVELERDMATMKGEPKRLFRPGGRAKGGGFEGHEFFEASSMRKIGGRYHFIYSSTNGNELCHATGTSPLGPFTYRGTLVSNGDLFLDGRTRPAEAFNYTGNTHGSLVVIEGRWYVFYHRQTNRHQFSRQACAEPVTVLPDGTIPQAPLSSCGLNGGPLRGEGTYEARIACHLMHRDGPGAYAFGKLNDRFLAHPAFTQSGVDREGDPDQYVSNLTDGSLAGFKSFAMQGLASIAVSTRGTGEGVLEVATAMHGVPVGRIPLAPSADWASTEAPVAVPDGEQALYFTFRGTGSVDFRSFELKR